MQLRISPSMRSITILTSGNNGFLDSMKVKVAARHISYRTLFHTILALAFLLPFVFILTAVVTLEGVNNCSSLGIYLLGMETSNTSFGFQFLRIVRDLEFRLHEEHFRILSEIFSFITALHADKYNLGSNRHRDPRSILFCRDCLGRHLGPRFLGRGHDDSKRLVKDFYKILNRVNSEDLPLKLKLPESFSELISEMKNNQYDGRTFAIRLKAMMENMDKEMKKTRLAEQLHKHYASSAIPKGIHCLSLRLTDEYSSNAHARKQLPPPELLPLLSDNSYMHFVLASDNILAASVVVTSAIRSSLQPEKMVFHVITDKKTYPGMHSWFALNHVPPAIVEVKSVHQFGWLTRENVPVIDAIENHQGVRMHYHGDHVAGTNVSDNPKVFASKLQARSPTYISLLNHLRIYLPELFPNLNKLIFLDDDVVIQRDLSPLWEIDLMGKVNGAVETCRGEDKWVMSKCFRTYFNFSNPLISKSLDPDECAWAYGMNIFDLNAWRKTNIRELYHYWVKENLKSNLTLWKFGTLPPGLIAFRGHVHPLDPSWHMLGLGYQEKTNLDSVRKAAVIHYNGQCKPWLEIGFKHLQPFWTKHVNYSNDFIKNCHIMEPQYIQR